MPRIVDAHVDLGVADDVEVVLGEVGGHDARHQRLDFGNRLVLDGGIDRHRTGRDAGAASDHQHFLRLRRNQRRQMTEHALQAHVLRFAGRLHFAGVVIVAHAVGELGHRHRRVDAFADVDDVGLAEPRRRVAAVGNEQTG
jgi:hypothetical protein